MDKFLTVFEISLNSNWAFGRGVIGFTFGLALILIGLLISIRRIRGSGEKKKLEEPVITSIGGLVLIVWSLFTPFQEISYLVSCYKHKDYAVVEGPVVVLHRQPEEGHDTGDVVEIGGRKFEINYYQSTASYHKTISHGGFLKEGAYARVYFKDGEILRVDIRST